MKNYFTKQVPNTKNTPKWSNNKPRINNNKIITLEWAAVNATEMGGLRACGSFMFLFCLVFAVSLCASVCALWSPAGKGLTSWLSFVVSAVSL